MSGIEAPAAAREPLLHLQRVSKSYHVGGVAVPVLQDISLSVQRGEMVSLMGPSGCGKSTLLGIVGLLDRPSVGSYAIDGRDTMALGDDDISRLRNRTIGFVFQGFNLIPVLNVIDNVCVPLQYRGVDDEQGHERARGLLARVGLERFAEYRPSRLSGGQQQRVAIARALVGSPSLILADEPTGALDSRTAEDIMGLFRQLNEEDHVTVVYVTHDPRAAGFAHRMVRLLDGRVVDN